MTEEEYRLQTPRAAEMFLKHSTCACIYKSVVTSTYTQPNLISNLHIHRFLPGLPQQLAHLPKSGITFYSIHSIKIFTIWWLSDRNLVGTYALFSSPSCLFSKLKLFITPVPLCPPCETCVTSWFCHNG